MSALNWDRCHIGPAPKPRPRRPLDVRLIGFLLDAGRVGITLVAFLALLALFGLAVAFGGIVVGGWR